MHNPGYCYDARGPLPPPVLQILRAILEHPPGGLDPCGSQVLSSWTFEPTSLLKKAKLILVHNNRTRFTFIEIISNCITDVDQLQWLVWRKTCDNWLKMLSVLIMLQCLCCIMHYAVLLVLSSILLVCLSRPLHPPYWLSPSTYHLS